MKKLFWFFVIISCSVPTIMALFNPGFFQSDDGEWMIIRFSAFHQALVDGQFPVRYLSRLNYGYGYPVANFLYPGFMYFGEVFKILGFGFVQSIKIILGISMVGSALFTFLWLSNLFKKWPSLVGALLYLYAPYHLFDIYKRGSVGETLALCVIPFVFWQIERKSFFWTALGVGFLILSHNSLALLFLPIIALYLLARGLAWAIYFLPTIFIGLGIASFFWIPAIFDLQYTVFAKTQVSDWEKYFSDYNLIGAIPILVLVWFMFNLNFIKNRVAILLFILTIVFLFLSLSLSSSVWKILPISFVQFPFRFLSVVILLVAFLSAFLLDKTKGFYSLLIGITFLAIGFLASQPYLNPSMLFDKGDSYYATNQDSTTVKNEYMPKWVIHGPTQHYEDKIEILHSTVSNLKIRSNNISFDTTSPEKTSATINTIYFPGWKVFVDREPSNFSYNNDKGIIKIDLPAGMHKVEVNFSETPVRLISDVISVASLLILFAIVIDRSRRLAA